MTILNEFVIIESIPFSEYLNAAHTFEEFRQLLNEHLAIQRLIVRLNIYFSDHSVVYYRVLKLLNLDYHYDTAIVGYLYVLHVTQSHLLSDIKTSILKQDNLIRSHKLISLLEDTNDA